MDGMDADVQGGNPSRSPVRMNSSVLARTSTADPAAAASRLFALNHLVISRSDVRGCTLQHADAPPAGSTHTCRDLICVHVAS
jgi:hypothetical protein